MLAPRGLAFAAADALPSLVFWWCRAVDGAVTAALTLPPPTVAIAECDRAKGTATLALDELCVCAVAVEEGASTLGTPRADSAREPPVVAVAPCRRLSGVAKRDGEEGLPRPIAEGAVASRSNEATPMPAESDALFRADATIAKSDGPPSPLPPLQTEEARKEARFAFVVAAEEEEGGADVFFEGLTGDGGGFLLFSFSFAANGALAFLTGVPTAAPSYASRFSATDEEERGPTTSSQASPSSHSSESQTTPSSAPPPPRSRCELALLPLRPAPAKIAAAPATVRRVAGERGEWGDPLPVGGEAAEDAVGEAEGKRESPPKLNPSS